MNENNFERTDLVKSWIWTVKGVIERLEQVTWNTNRPEKFDHLIGGLITTYNTFCGLARVGKYISSVKYRKPIEMICDNIEMSLDYLCDDCDNEAQQEIKDIIKIIYSIDWEATGEPVTADEKEEAEKRYSGYIIRSK